MSLEVLSPTLTSALHSRPTDPTAWTMRTGLPWSISYSAQVCAHPLHTKVLDMGMAGRVTIPFLEELTV